MRPTAIAVGFVILIAAVAGATAPPARPDVPPAAPARAAAASTSVERAGHRGDDVHDGPLPLASAADALASAWPSLDAPLANSAIVAGTATAPPTAEGPFAALRPLRFVSRNSGERVTARLYGDDGSLDEGACERLDALFADTRARRPYPVARIDRRLLRLVVKAAYHFEATEVTVVSAYRKPGRWAEGLHGKGRAVDFQLDNAPSSAVAAFLRGLARVGVGEYTHPRTRFVHLDVRDASYHWVDGTPPGKRWGEARLSLQGLDRLDGAYHERDDLPDAPAPDDAP